VTDETLISFKELQKKYQLLLAENRFLKAELKGSQVFWCNQLFDVICCHAFLDSSGN